MSVAPSAAIRRWGILGGTFDPIHFAHLAVAQQALEELRLDGVLFVPAGQPPHKGDRMVTSGTHRAAMVELAISGNPCFRMSRLEIDRVGPSYSADTVEQLAATGGALEGAELTFLLSADGLVGLPTWHEPARLLAACTIAVAPRLGFARPERAWLSEHFPGREDRFAFLNGPDLGHSASDIRRRAATGCSIRYLVPAAVAAYVDRNRLYPSER